MSEPFVIDSKNIDFPIIMEEVSKTAAFLELSHSDSLKLTLMTEEMLEMMKEIIYSFFGRFWMETSDKKVILHLEMLSRKLSQEEKDILIAASTSGQNVAEKGLKGRILSMIKHGNKGKSELESESDLFVRTDEDLYTGTMYVLNTDPDEGKRVITKIKDIEHSILTSVADEIKVGIQSDKAEVIVVKNFA